MGYYVVEKDKEDIIGCIFSKEYKSFKEAKQYADKLKLQLGEYYDVFVAEKED
jgi:hypothetical protein